MEMDDDEFKDYLKFLMTMLDRMQADGSLDQYLKEDEPLD